MDQKVESVSYCGADLYNERGFSYICRDSTSCRWMCHGFLSTKHPGERISQAVGYAFKILLERPMFIGKENSVTIKFDQQTSAFTRIGSFRPKTRTERLHNERGIDVAKKPSANVPPQPKPTPKPPYNPHAIERPHASPSMLERQRSFRGFNTLNNLSPFKRQMSLRLRDLPSNAERQRVFLETMSNGNFMRTSSPIQEVTPQPQAQQPEINVVSALCKELSQGLSMLTRHENVEKLNFNLQTTSTTTTFDCALPSSADVIPKFKRIEATPPITSVPIKPLPTNVCILDGTNTNNVNPVSPMPRVSPISQVPSNENKAIESNRTESVSSVIVPTNNCQPLNDEQWLGEIDEIMAPEATKQSTPLHTPEKSLADPFDANWVSAQIDEMTNLPAAIEPIITNTNPFISPQMQVEFVTEL